jgi:hypothetical protein
VEPRLIAVHGVQNDLQGVTVIVVISAAID